MDLPEIVNVVIQHADLFYQESRKPDHACDLEWEHCYESFCQAIRNGDLSPETVEWLTLHLTVYLSLYGMYRRSSFLTFSDSRIHQGAVEVILEERYRGLLALTSDRYEEQADILQDLIERLDRYYRPLRNEIVIRNQQEKHIPEKEPVSQVSGTLISKILLGTLGCVPAYDEYFTKGIEGIAGKTFGMSSIGKIYSFYRNHESVIDAERSRMKISESGIIYPPMKYLDMGFWHCGKYGKISE